MPQPSIHQLFHSLHNSIDHLLFILKNINTTPPHLNSLNQIDRIFYINLDHRTDRKIHIEHQIINILDHDLSNTLRIPGVIYNRFTGRLKGAIGCTMAHLNAINYAIHHNLHNVIILEDDFEFLCDRPTFLNDLQRFLLTQPYYDILLLGVNSPNAKYLTQSNPNHFIQINYSQTTSGYILSNRGLHKMRNICNKSIQNLIQTKNVSKHAIDIQWNSIMNDGQVFAFPYRVGKQIQSYSDIEMQLVSYPV